MGAELVKGLKVAFNLGSVDPTGTLEALLFVRTCS